jgi:2-dehydropantoate 2-reductase
MKNKTRILVVGMGGVGGYFGGHLARKYEGSEEVEIIFAARGDHYEQMVKHGLKIIERGTHFIAQPAIITNNMASLGVVDYILVCTKSYHLPHLIEQMQPCAGPHTLILPLLNGVDGFEILQRAFPQSIVIPGCVYIVSTINEPGVIENKGHIQSLFLGATGKTPVPGLSELNALLTGAGLDAHLVTNILTVIWEKFIFIATTASATTYYNLGVGSVAREQEDMVIQLINEVVSIGKAKNIPLSSTIHEDTLAKLKSMPEDATSSMQRDFRAQKKHTELETLTGYVVHAGKELNIPTPVFDLIYQQLKQPY